MRSQHIEPVLDRYFKHFSLAKEFHFLTILLSQGVVL